MKVFRSLAELDPFATRSVVTIGNFDGVHRGHQMVLSHVRHRAQALHARSVAVTFDPHPANLLRPDVPSPRLTSLDEKLRLLALSGIDETLVLPFTEELRQWTARQFAETVLRDSLSAVEVHEGETFRFGHGAEAGIGGLIELGHACSFAVSEHTPLILRGAPVSSSRIRKLIAAGNVSEARTLLARPHSVQSTPARGRGYGTRYAVPTINLAPVATLLPANGVYITTLRIGSSASARTFRGVTNAGNRPTFGADSFAVESYLFDFEPLDLTEETPLELSFLRRIRDERRFDSPEALKAQIGRDVAHAQRFFALCDALKLEA